MTVNTVPSNLEKARIQLIYKEFFYGSILHGMPCVEFEQPNAMATDGRVIFYNREMIKDMPVPQIQGVLIHEIMHKIYKHHLRMDDLLKGAPDDETKAKVAKKWNHATDYVINQMVLDENYTLPENVLLDTKWRGHSSEQVYAKLPDDPPGDTGACGELIAPEGGMSDEDKQSEADQIETEVRAAAEAAKARGKVPAHIEQLISEWDEAKIDWKSRLWKACDTHGNAWEDVTWERPNRRFIQHGMYLPTPQEFGPGPVVIAADNSGSVSKDEFLAMVGEMGGIIQDTKPESVRLIQCDAAINSDITIDPSFEDLPTDFKRTGCGGTSFEPPFDVLEKEGLTPQYMIYMTDGYAPFPKEPDYPVIWLITSKDITAPWGETIHLQID